MATRMCEIVATVVKPLGPGVRGGIGGAAGGVGGIGGAAGGAGGGDKLGASELVALAAPVASEVSVANASCIERHLLARDDFVARRQVQIVHVEVDNRVGWRIQPERRSLDRRIAPPVRVDPAASVDGI
eukprot:1690449-Prymnesium_polylepis.2